MFKHIATVSQPMEMKCDEFTIKGYAGRLYRLNIGDIFVLNDIGIEEQFRLSIKKIPLGEILDPGVICLEKIKRKHWWQFWKKKYTGARFMYVGKVN